jgi:branched-subunit amino acid transport protein
MNTWMWLIVAAAVITFVTRISGFQIGEQRLPVRLRRALDYIPVAAFAALAIPDVAAGVGTFPARALGALAASVIILRFGVLWGGLAAGMATFWIVGVL